MKNNNFSYLSKNNLRLLNTDSIFEETFKEFDRIFGNIDKKNDSFPPANIKKTNTGYVIEMALAGYKKEDISVKQEESELLISAKKTQEETTEGVSYLHKGISSKSFTRSFYLEKGSEVDEVTLTDGILSVTITKNLPEKVTKTFDIK